MRVKTLFVNFTLLAVTAAVGLLLCEGVARLTLRPADYLSVEMVKDDILAAAPSPNTRASGFDAWGFRNRNVPATADIVAIGDSQTYGNTVAMDDSWPYVLGRLSGQRVYNMGLGGYGPNQYFYLLKTKALSLKPRIIVVGLSMTDDFENAFKITYGLDYWAYLRALPLENVNFDIWQEPAATSWHKRIRLWLSRHSVTYQIIVHGPVLGRLQGEVQIQNALHLSDAASLLNVPEKNISEAFLPIEVMRVNDPQNQSVREGMRITLELLAQMDEICRQNHIQFIVAVIPTKEMVFSEYFDDDPNLALRDVLHRLVTNERSARERIFKFFSDSHIAYVDALPGLKGSAEHKIYTRLAGDMHPNKNGFRIIGEAVFEAVKRNEEQK